MRLEWLDDILAVLETGSLAAAAERRFVTQPAFSRRIMAIEAHLGVELLDRSRRPARMKPAVRDQRERIQELATGLRTLQDDLRRQDRQVQNRVVISCQHAITTSIAPSLVERLSADKALSIRLRSANREECYAQLMTKQADMALLYESETEPLPPADDYLERIEVGSEPLLPVFATNRVEKLNQDYALGEIPIIAYPPEVFLGKVMNQEVLAGFAQLSFIRKRAETALTLAVKQLASAGVGVAWLPDSLVASDVEAGRLSDLSDLLPMGRLTIVAMRLRVDAGAGLGRVWDEVTAMAADFSEPYGTNPLF
ncbi:LysR family transcriptional regulator [Amorphus sp. 3PC139-8]|uniref:LysR family transcriptional regulator n=1 Tax=Amorphus sp. 3PC139-8 TaxID=2735676 RepID=UPI00345D14CA